MILYPSLAAEIPGVILEQDLPIPTIEDKIEPQDQDRAKDAVARNANLEPFDVAGVNAPMIIRANNDDINKISDDNNCILLIATIPANNNHGPLILPNTSDSDTLDDKDKSKDKDNNEMFQAMTIYCRWMAKRLANRRRDLQTIKIRECAEPSSTTREWQQNTQTTA